VRTVSPSVPVLRGPDASGRHSTEPGDVDERRLKRGRLGRRAFLSVLTLFVLCGLLGLFGVRERQATVTDGEWTVTATYPGVTRAGLAVPLEFQITRQGGFDETVVVRMTSDYFDLFDENSFEPTPSKEWTDDEYVYWEFDAPPDSQTMVIGTDTRTGSSVQLTQKKAELSVMVDGEPAVTVGLKTWVMF